MPISDHPLYDVFCTVTGNVSSPLIVMTSPLSREGTSFVARDFALMVAQHYAPQGHRVALIDYDLNTQSHGFYFDDPRSQNIYGALQGPYDATFGQKPFWHISPDIVTEEAHRAADNVACSLFLVGETGLAITRFNWAAIKAGQTVHIARSPDYWQVLKQNFAFIVIDCPAFDRSDIGLNVIPESDSVLLVSSEGHVKHPAHTQLAATISQAGGSCAGLIINAGTQSNPSATYPAS